ncbi:hypothetical protein HXA34_17020 [Salipaludibacillus agaradhaerens]|uniref:hypothetical protein n=1 Tax=Salipaludibacillus agaradhaerens TaxID=76935 RepID=UPI002150FB37|nr:hypothetical protein [Salipaludibacillus agaradhaerens]MCR6107995.1 hypothetical protein [Salipaludibacillus agaradhaerens]MCR6120022.1 hypothetical protein [Salipaludibacillus agaradhaerens]
MKNKKRVMLGAIPLVLFLLVGVIWMNNGFGDWSERNREEIEENVKRYVARYKLDPENVEIKYITEPKNYPTGEKEFSVFITYDGSINFSYTLTGNSETLNFIEPDEHIIERIFNEMYLIARLEEFSPAINYLDDLGVEDPLRSNSKSLAYLQTSVGHSAEINSDLKEAFRKGDDLVHLENYIEENIEKINKVGSSFRIVGSKEGISEDEAISIKTHLEELLPEANYQIQIGMRDPDTGVGIEGIYEQLNLRGD